MIHDALPERKILIIDAGPRLTETAGRHVKNISDEKERELAQIKSQGPHQHQYPLVTVAERAGAVQAGKLNLDLLARPGTHLLSETDTDLAKNEMPAAAHSTNIGGMGAHWTCACPRPGNRERIPFIPADEFEKAYSKAEQLLCVTQKAFPASPEGLAIQRILGKIFNPKLSKEREVQPMPLACKVDEDGNQYWVGPDIILGDLALNHNQGNVEIWSDTICRRLEKQEGHITAAFVENLSSKINTEIKAKVYILACDALRTPQLLWASGIRPKALGHYLNEHPFVFAFVELKDELVDKTAAEAYNPQNRKEQTIGVFWIPYDSPGHPFHAQIMHMDLSPLKIETHNNPKHIVGLGWGTIKEIRYEDHIEFSESEKDFYGMPKMNIRFSLTENDWAQIEKAKALQRKAMEAFGKEIREGEQTLMPAGTSLHAQGTVRMGEKDDGQSVCNPHGKVWGYDNLFVGGNGVIPMATTSNPTLTSVAMATRSAEKIVELLKQLEFQEQKV
jgi:pyranose oxidase